MEFGKFQKIKRSFFSYRNGVTADALRKAGSPFQIIFGLNYPQLTAISSETGVDKELAERLWANRSTRCSMLLAPMIYPAEEFSYETALKWCGEAPSTEVADILCKKLLSKTVFRRSLIECLKFGSDIEKYICLRLIQQLVRSEGGLESENEMFVQKAANGEFGVACRLIAFQINDDMTLL